VSYAIDSIRPSLAYLVCGDASVTIGSAAASKRALTKSTS
jgi:hypothetical protein